MNRLRQILRRLVLWALGNEYPKIYIVRKTERAEIQQKESPVNMNIDIRVPRKVKK